MQVITPSDLILGGFPGTESSAQMNSEYIWLERKNDGSKVLHHRNEYQGGTPARSNHMLALGLCRRGLRVGGGVRQSISGSNVNIT